jgi:hypothetical protein
MPGVCMHVYMFTGTFWIHGYIEVSLILLVSVSMFDLDSSAYVVNKTI